MRRRLEGNYESFVCRCTKDQVLSCFIEIIRLAVVPVTKKTRVILALFLDRSLLSAYFQTLNEQWIFLVKLLMPHFNFGWPMLNPSSVFACPNGWHFYLRYFSLLRFGIFMATLSEDSIFTPRLNLQECVPFFWISQKLLQCVTEKWIVTTNIPIFLHGSSSQSTKPVNAKEVFSRFIRNNTSVH